MIVALFCSDKNSECFGNLLLCAVEWKKYININCVVFYDLTV